MLSMVTQLTHCYGVPMWSLFLTKELCLSGIGEVSSQKHTPKDMCYDEIGLCAHFPFNRQ